MSGQHNEVNEPAIETTPRFLYLHHSFTRPIPLRMPLVIALGQ